MARKRLKRRPRALPRTPGSPPGTFEIPEESSGTTHAMCFDQHTCDSFVLHTPSDVLALKSRMTPGTIVWVDMCGLEKAKLHALIATFGLHPLAVEDAVHTHQRAKVEAYPGHDLLIARMVDYIDGDPSSEQVSLFIGEGFIVSMQEFPGDPWGPVRDRIKGGDRRLREGGTDHLAYALLDAIVDHYFPLLGQIGERIEDLEASIIEHPRDENLLEIQRLRRLLILFRRHAWPMRDAVQALVRGDMAFVKPDTRVYLRDTLDHLFRIVELLESYRDTLSGLMDLHLSAINIRMNQVVQVLTVISTIFIPLTFIAGVYGMNFDPDSSPLNMPELRAYFGYPAVMFGMGVIGFGLLFLFWRRGWLGRGLRRGGGPPFDQR